MYAILDIETTGGKFNEEGITEIAVYRFDGHRITDQFISLVNPEIPIQPFVVGLTGINNAMLRNAPRFFEVAKRIVEITDGAILVAHNAKFDYRILRTEFRRLGFEYDRKSLCTVELAKKLIPGQQSYSLGKLVRALGIPITSRHRANGDAQATVKLFKMLLAKDTEKEIVRNAVRNAPRLQMDAKLIALLEELPSVTGVYYLYNSDGVIIYIGKSKNIRKRVNQHFTSENRKSLEIQKEVASISYEATGNELNALLKENEEIKRNRPKFNKALKRNIFSYALYSSYDDQGYLRLQVGKADGRKKNITTFTNLQQAKTMLNDIVKEFGLCQRLTGLEKGKSSCFNYNIKKCAGACVGKESSTSYNERVQNVLQKYSYSNKNMIVVDRGREVDEKSALLVEGGQFRGIGYFNLNYQLQNLEIIRSVITPMKNDRDAQHIIQSYLRKNTRLKIIKLETANQI